MLYKNTVSGLVIISHLFLYSLSHADSFRNERHGSIPTQPKNIVLEAGSTISYQHSNDNRIDEQLFISLDLVSVVPTNNGQWVLYVEGNTTAKTNGLSKIISEANGDVGSALDRDDKGRMQVSELHYLHYFNDKAILIGLLNTASTLDNSDTANDETTQFINTSLINNPSIAFPDYALGVNYIIEGNPKDAYYHFLISSSHGLADNTNKSYSELFDIHDDGKGLFAAAEVHWYLNNYEWRVGVWINTADNTYVDGSGNTENNYGVYVSSDFKYTDSILNLRLGLANDDVSQADSFIGVAYQTKLIEHEFGIGLTHTGVSSKLVGNVDDSTQAEVYIVFEPYEEVLVTPSVQWIKNSGFDSSNTNFDNSVMVYTVRAQYNF